MPKKTTAKRKMKVRRSNVAIRGGGIIDTIKNGARKLHKFIKENKIISRGAKLLDSAGVPYAGTIHGVAEHYGYGRPRRKIVRIIRGRGRTKLEKGLLP